jgi:leucine-rich repeat protein SHOC2
LNIGQNKIKTLPDEFEKLQSLENIRFDSNGMDTFPLVLIKLVNLEEIICNTNSIKELPEEI